MTPDPAVPPVRIETLKEYARSIFEPLKRGESVTAVWVPLAGRRTWSRFIIANLELFSDVVGDPSIYLLVYLEPLELTEESLTGYIRLMGKSVLDACREHDCLGELQESVVEEKMSVFSDESKTYAQLLGELRSLIQRIIDLKTEVVFFLGRFDSLGFANALFYDNLKSIWTSLQPFLHYIFLVNTNIIGFNEIRKFGSLVEVIMQNVVYTPLLGDEDIEYVIDLNEKRLNDEFKAEERKVLKEVCGGHPYLLKTGCRVLSKIEERSKINAEKMVEILLRHYHLKSAARELFELRDGREQAILEKMVENRVKKLPEGGAILENLGLVTKDEAGSYLPFSGSFKRVILGDSQEMTARKGIPRMLSLHQGNGTILFGDQPVEEKFTCQEYEVLTLFLGEPNKLRTRDEISDVLWGEDSYEKYSDWAIDQLISKLRKKLEKLGVNKNTLVTVRGRGYKFLNPSPVNK